jgi:hypothetical protein
MFVSHYEAHDISCTCILIHHIQYMVKSTIYKTQNNIIKAYAVTCNSDIIHFILRLHFAAS